MQLQTQKILRTDIICIINGEEGRGSHQLGRGEGEGEGGIHQWERGRRGNHQEENSVEQKKKKPECDTFFQQQ